jgi:hypothetical protein
MLRVSQITLRHRHRHREGGRAAFRVTYSYPNVRMCVNEGLKEYQEHPTHIEGKKQSLTHALMCSVGIRSSILSICPSINSIVLLTMVVVNGCSPRQILQAAP